MGNSQSFTDSYTYHVAIADTAKPGSTAVYRAASHPDELVCSFVDREVTNAYHFFELAVKKCGQRRWLGKRFHNRDGGLGDFEWITYSTGQRMALSFGSTLVKENLVSEQSFPNEIYGKARSMRIVGLYAKNCVEWFLAEQACNAYNFTLCPVYDTLGDEAMVYILRETKMDTSLVSFECFPTLLKMITDPNDPSQMIPESRLKTIILVDPPFIPEGEGDLRELFLELKEQGSKIGLDVRMWQDMVAKGAGHITPCPGPIDSVNTLCYTSGTTGLPKGVILPQSTVIAVVVAAHRGPVSSTGIFEISQSDVVLSYLPLAHVFERSVCNIVMAAGAAIGVYSGDMAKLLDDIKVLRPTVFISVPRLFNRINDRIAMTLQEKKLPTQILFAQGVNSKVSRRRSDSVVKHRIYDAVVFAKVRAMMGGRLRGMICGGAPLDPSVCDRMMAFFSAPLMQGYGLSESFGPCFLMHPSDPASGYIGGIWPGTEFCLTSVPELDYLVTDRPPRGELWLRGPAVAHGYFANAEETRAVFDEDGWFHTGDICVLHPKTLGVKIIDRKKNIFKLSQGEYVAPEKVEGVYSQALLVGQIFVFGYSHKTALVGIIIPDEDAAAKWQERNGKGRRSLTQLCQDSAFKAAILADMEGVAAKNGLKGFEKVKQIALSPEAFTVENNQLTPTIKIRRNEVLKRYRKEIDQMYEHII